jgi:hypothetical protein
MKRSTAWLIGAALLSISCAFQIMALVRYVDRSPDDNVGLGLFIAAAIGFAIAAIGFSVQWRKAKIEEEHEK